MGYIECLLMTFFFQMFVLWMVIPTLRDRNGTRVANRSVSVMTARLGHTHVQKGRQNNQSLLRLLTKNCKEGCDWLKTQDRNGARAANRSVSVMMARLEHTHVQKGRQTSQSLLRLLTKNCKEGCDWLKTQDRNGARDVNKSVSVMMARLGHTHVQKGRQNSQSLLSFLT